MPWTDQVQGYFKKDGSIRSSDSLYLGEPDSVLTQKGKIAEGHLYVPTSIITKAIRAPKGSRSAHSLTETDIIRLDQGIEYPAAVIYNPARNALMYITGNKTAENDNVIATFDLNNDLYGENAHRCTSIHARENISGLLQNLGRDAIVYITDKTKFDSLFTGLQSDNSPELLATVELVDDSVAQEREKVNAGFDNGLGVTGPGPGRVGEKHSQFSMAMDEGDDSLGMFDPNAEEFGGVLEQKDRKAERLTKAQAAGEYKPKNPRPDNGLDVTGPGFANQNSNKKDTQQTATSPLSGRPSKMGSIGTDHQVTAAAELLGIDANITLKKEAVKEKGSLPA